MYFFPFLCIQFRERLFFSAAALSAASEGYQAWDEAEEAAVRELSRCEDEAREIATTLASASTATVNIGRALDRAIETSEVE
jgi:archaellum component FlaF (FlaF/FlaG flagellin family)